LSRMGRPLTTTLFAAWVRAPGYFSFSVCTYQTLYLSTTTYCGHLPPRTVRPYIPRLTELWLFFPCFQVLRAAQYQIMPGHKPSYLANLPLKSEDLTNHELNVLFPL
jgi:hypothetical protein